MGQHRAEALYEYFAALDLAWAWRALVDNELQTRSQERPQT